MSLKGTAMTNKVLRGKIKDIHQIEDIEALFAEAEELIERAEELIALILKLNRIDYINLLSANWEQNGERLYTQVVAVNGVTANSFIEICFSPAQLETFSTKDISFSVVNAGGEVTVTCVGQKPTSDYRLQVKITEVSTNV